MKHKSVTLKKQPPCAQDFWVGVDLAKNTFQASRAPLGVATAAWHGLPQASFANTSQGRREFARWIADQSRQLGGGRCLGIAVEATGGLSRRFEEDLAALKKNLPRPSILNPAFVKAFGKSLGQRSKNDKLDAAVLAVFGSVHKPAPAAPLSPAQQRLRELDRLRQSLVEQQTAWLNSRGEAREALALKTIDQQLKLVGEQIERLEDEMDQIIKDDPDLKRQYDLLDSVPGIGPRVAVTILAELGDLSQYRRDDLVGYVGLFAREHRSGSSVRRRGHLVKGGGARVRRCLGLAAMAVGRSKSDLKRFSLGLIEKGKTKLCALGAMMRKLLLIARAVIISGHPYDPSLATRKEHKKVMASV
jgi:transposase